MKTRRTKGGRGQEPPDVFAGGKQAPLVSVKQEVMRLAKDLRSRNPALRRKSILGLRDFLGKHSEDPEVLGLVPALLKILKRGHASPRKFGLSSVECGGVTDAFVAMGLPVMPELLKSLGFKECADALCLISSRNPRSPGVLAVVPTLLGLLENRCPGDARHAVTSLAELARSNPGSPEVMGTVPTLLEKSERSESETVRADAIEVLGHIATANPDSEETSSEIMPALNSARQDRSPLVRKQAETVHNLFKRRVIKLVD